MNVPKTQLSKQQLEALIRDESQDTSKVFFTTHAQQQMRSRGITNACVLDALRNGQLRRTPEPNLMKGNLECRMERFSTGRGIAVVVAVSDEDPDLIIVTAMYTK